jgi:hypothetical protein
MAFVVLMLVGFVCLALWRSGEPPRPKDEQEMIIKENPVRIPTPNEALRNCSKSLTLCINDIPKRDGGLIVHLSNAQRSLMAASNLRLVSKSADTIAYRGLYMDLLQLHSSMLIFLDSKHSEEKTAEFARESLIALRELDSKIEIHLDK